jgi:5-formyltetrahydrofolate cyclo-ligase
LYVEETKASLRREYREARTGFARKSGVEARLAIETNMIRVIRDLAEEGAQVGLYRPLKEEALFELEPPSRFFYPRIEGDELEFYRPRTGKFVPGKLGIDEPDPEDSDKLESGKPHIIFTPAVAVDSQGGRLGMGKGYYDRFFKRHPEVIRVGVVYQVQVSKHPLPREYWDQLLDWIVTEQMILETSTRSS